MGVHALFPIAKVLTLLKLNGKFHNDQARHLFDRVQTAQDMGATMVQLTEDDYRFVCQLHLEDKYIKPAAIPSVADEDYKD